VYRRIATRYDKPAGSFVKLVAIALKRWETLGNAAIATNCGIFCRHYGEIAIVVDNTINRRV
jgi:hypothetical protein